MPRQDLPLGGSGSNESPAPQEGVAPGARSAAKQHRGILYVHTGRFVNSHSFKGYRRTNGEPIANELEPVASETESTGISTPVYVRVLGCVTRPARLPRR